MNYKILISSSHIAASQNGITRQTEEMVLAKVLHNIQSKLVSLASRYTYAVHSITFLLSGKALYPIKYCHVSTLTSI